MIKMPDKNNIADNYFGEVENEEIQFYDVAFPSMNISNYTDDGQKSIKFSTDFSELSLLNVEKSVKSSVFTTDTFVIPFEERRYIESDTGSAIRLKRLLTDICASCGVMVETNITTDDGLRVFIRGPKVSVVESKKRFMKLLQTQYEIVLDIPKEFHRNLIGTKGSLLRELESETSTQISIPKPNDISTNIRVKGTKDNVEHAKQQIQKIIDELSKVGRQVVEIDKRYHQLVCHKSNISLYVVIEHKNLRLDIPPLSVNKNEISISGDREGVSQAASILLQTYNNMRNTFQELRIEIPKEKHRFIIGPKGSGIKEILDKTNVWIEINDLKTSENTICLLGPKENLGNALTMVFVKSESVNITNVNAPGWLHKFIIGRNGSNLMELSSNKPSIHLSFETDLNQIVIEGPPEDVEEVSKLLKQKVFDLQSQLSQTELEIDPIMIKHVIGSGGSNVQKIRKDTNCTIMFPRDPTKRVVTIVGKPGEVETARLMLLKTIEIIENTKKKDVIFKHDFLPQLIGQNGKGLKEIKEKYPKVRINVPSQDSDSDIISLIGPRKHVDEVATFLQKKNINMIESNYSEKISIPNKYHRLIIGKDGLTIKELTKATNTKFIIPPVKEEKDEIIIIGKKCDVQNAIIKVYNIYEKESNIIEVGIEIPKNLHTILIGKGGSRINSFKESCGGQFGVRFPNSETESNTVIIKGIKEDVFKAQIKLHELVKEITLSNYEECFSLTAEEFDFLFMSQDLRFKKLKEVYHIRISQLEDQSLKISGQKENVISVVQLLNKAKSEQGPIIIENLSLATDHIAYFKESGENIRIGKDHKCKISILNNNAENMNYESVIMFKGPEKNIKTAKEEILEIVKNYENTITECLIIDENQLENMKRFCHEQLMEISRTLKVAIKIPLYPESRENSSDLRISSKPLDKCDMNGVDSSFSEEESYKSLSPNGDNLSNDLNQDCLNRSHKNANMSEPNSEVSSTISSGIDLLNKCKPKIKLPKYKIELTGLMDGVHLAKDEIIKLFILELEVDVPEEYYPALIGNKGTKIKELRDKHHVNVFIHTKSIKYKKVIVSGPSVNAVAAKKEILEFIMELEKIKQERLDRNSRDTIDIPVEYHTKLIGSKGENISKIRNKYTVRINVPSIENKSSEIIIIGHKDNVESAKKELELFVHKLHNNVIESLHIEAKLHSRLIGSRGANIDQLKKKYKVEIVFPLRGMEGDEANVVKIKGTKEGVDKCADELIERANEMLQDMDKQSNSKPQYSSGQSVSDNSDHYIHTSSVLRSSGFKLLDAPWHHLSNPEQLENNNDIGVIPQTSNSIVWSKLLTK